MSTRAATPQEKKDFVRDGAVICREFVPADLVNRARTMIDDWCRTELRHDLINSYTQRTFAPELGTHNHLLALYHESGVAELVASLVGDAQPVATAQVQIRLPETRTGQAQPIKAMHVDGVACPHLDPAELRTFTLLVGVVLSDITDPDGGALHYVPGGHQRMSEWFRTEWSAGMTDQVPAHIDAEEGVPLLGIPGDVLLMHHLVPHAAGRNNTGTPRVMVYFRVTHSRHAEQRLEALRDPWLEYSPLHPIAV